MKRALFCSGLGLIIGGVFCALVPLSAIENGFGFVSSDPNVIEVEESELSLMKWAIFGCFVGSYVGFGVGMGQRFNETQLKRLASLPENEHLFTVEALVDLGVVDHD